MAIASELSKKALLDEHPYDPLEVAHASLDEATLNLYKCAELHDQNKWFQYFDEFCVCIFFTEGEGLLKNLRRQKFCAFPYLPDPRPQQAVFLFNRVKQTFTRLWCLPNAAVMAICSEMTNVASSWKTTKKWSDAWFEGKTKHYNIFFNLIKRESKTKLSHRFDWRDKVRPQILSELDRAEFLNLFADEIEGSSSDPFDFSKVAVHEVIDNNKVGLN